MILQCATCGKDVEKSPSIVKRSKTGNVYCNKTCAVSNNNKLFKKWENHPQYRNGLRSYRTIKFSSVEEPKCERCGFDNTLALEVHHKDRDRKNNSLDNLEILCCNCHAIEHNNRDVG